MLYQNIRPMLVYTGKKEFPLPKGEPIGYGKVLIMLTASQDDTIREIQTDFIRWYVDHYRFYTTDTYFREKIGKKMVMVNMNQVLRRDWQNTKFSFPLRYVPPKQRDAMLLKGASPNKKRVNLIYDMGEWIKLYFQYSFKVSIPIIVRNFINFIADKLSNDLLNSYDEKLVYIPINQWFTAKRIELGFRRNQLNNPLSILLFAVYRYPELLAKLPKCTYVFGDSLNGQYMIMRSEDMTKQNFQKIKMRLKGLSGFKWDDNSEELLETTFTDAEMDDESSLNNPEGNHDTYDDPRGIVPPPLDPNATDKDKAAYELKKENRARLINDMKRSLVGPPVDEKASQLATSFAGRSKSTNDPETKEESTTPSGSLKNDVKLKPTPHQKSVVTDAKTSTIKTKVGNPVASRAKADDLTKDSQVYDAADIEEQESDTTAIHLDDDDLDSLVEDAVDEELEKLQEEDPDALLNADDDLTIDKIAGGVTKNLRSFYMPKRTDEQIQRAKELRAMQERIIPTMPSAEQLKSKIVNESDFSNAVKTSNPKITHSKFVNFDKAYTDKKLQADIDAAVTQLSKASVGAFVVKKTEEDTSTPLDMKKTVTYVLEDEWGGRHKIKLDIPIVYEDKYIWKNGQKLLLGHQQIMMPIVKSNATDVVISTWYNKLTLRREGVNDTRTNSVKRFMESNNTRFGIKLGNAAAKNRDNHFSSTLDIDMYAKQMLGFHIGHTIFVLDRQELEKRIKEKMPSTITIIGEGAGSPGAIPVGYNVAKNEIVYVTDERSLTDIILSMLTPEERVKIAKASKSREQKMLRTNVKIMDVMVPIALLLFFYEGFETVMKKAAINYTVLDKETDDPATVDRSKYEILECADKYIVWERNPIWNTMFMNSLSRCGLEIFDYEELQNPETYANIISNYYTSKNAINSLMQFYDFMIDPATKEILEDFDLPTDLVSLILLGNKMLATNDFTAINNAAAFRVRSNEIIAEAVYDTITAAYFNFRKTQGKMGRKRAPDKIDVKKNAVMDIVTRVSSLTNEASVLNPILELEKARSITPRGPRGVGKDRAMTENKRAFDDSMLGIMAMTSSPDSKVGVNRQLTMEPRITSTRGYVTPGSKEDVEELNSANLLSAAEMLSPPGALHDDGPRTSMSFKQSQYMLPIDGSCPVFFGNKMEEIVPYHMSREFVITAKQDGQVVAIKDGLIIVQYKDGTYDSIDITPKMKKNASSGFFIRTHMVSKLDTVGQKFKKNEVIANDPRAFTKNQHDLSASMNIGVPIKLAIIPNYDIYEDSAPITQKLSEKFTTYMSMREEVGIPAQSFIQSIVKVGDRVEVGDPLIIYDPAHEDEETNAFLNEIRDKFGDSIYDVMNLESMPQVRTEYAGTIAAIEIYTSVPVEELSPSLQKVYRDLTAKSSKRVATLNQYSNEGDMKYFKCGRIIDDAPEVVPADYQNRVKGVMIGDDGRGVVIFFYIEFKDIAKTGDKGSAFTALKFITSHVIPKGKEPYSEYHPSEEISTFLSPSAILARKTPSIIKTMFANKCLIEMSRKAFDMFFEEEEDWK